MNDEACSVTGDARHGNHNIAAACTAGHWYTYAGVTPGGRSRSGSVRSNRTASLSGSKTRSGDRDGVSNPP